MRILRKLILCIDFDGTIVENKYPDIGNLREGAYHFIHKLKKDGHTIIIWTSRTDEDLDNARNFLLDYEIPFDYINSNAKEVIEEFGDCKEGKVFGNIYIDDRNLGGIPDWPTIYNEVNRYINNNFSW